MTDQIGRRGGGAFEDTDGDGVAELQDDHASLEGGDVRDAGTVSATTTETDAASRGTASQWGPRAQALRTEPALPTDWTRHSENPIITTTATVQNQASFPSLFHAGRFLSNPEAEWYLYWSGHDGGGIRLHTADQLEGPWEESPNSPVFTATDVGGGDHVASPSAIWHPEQDRLRVYYHRSYNNGTRLVQETELATSTDGVTFTKQGTVLGCPLDGSWDEQERSYMKVYRNGQEWIGFYDGRDSENNNKGLGYAWSPDGSAGSWRTLEHPWAFNSYIDGYDCRTDQQGPTPSLVEFGGQHYLINSIGTIGSRTLDAVRFDDPRQREASATTLLDPADATWEDSLEAPDLYYHDGRLWMFYNNIDPSTSDYERQIALAWVDLEGYR